MSDWRDEAACLDNWAPFDATEFEVRPDGTRLKHGEKALIEATAKSICYSCDVKTTCLAEALRHETPSTTFHVRAGLTADERKSILRRLSRKRTEDKKKAEEGAA